MKSEAEQVLSDICSMFRIPPETTPVDVARTVLLRLYKEKQLGPSRTRAFNAVQQCLLADDPLLAFATWYNYHLNGNYSFAQMYSVFETNLGHSITLFECKPFRVQLFLFRPGAVIPEHSHPGVESFEVYVAGNMQLTLEGKEKVDMRFVYDDDHGVCMSNGGMIRIPAGAVHGGHINDWTIATPPDGGIRCGGAFISIQYWKDGWEERTVARAWKGVDGSTNG